MAEDVQTCYRHHDRRAGVRCQRCERAICPQCMVSASVGFHCPECARSGRQKVLTARNLGSTPIATRVLVALNVAVFGLAIARSGASAIGDGGKLVLDAGLFGPYVWGVKHEWWRVITAGFLHYGIIHIALNMWALWIIGPQLERALGALRFVVLYVSALIAGSLGALILSPHDLTAGASGAIFGLLGCLLAYQRIHRIDIWASGLGGILLINLAITFGISGISIGGHLGGLAGGFLIGWIYFALTPKLADKLAPVALAAGVGVACFAACLYVAAQSIH